QQCSPPSVPPTPLNQVLSYNWSGDGSGGQILTWTDTHWVLIQGVDSNGCVTYSWVDEPITYRHDYPLNLSDFEVTGLFYDPGTPWSLWSPSNPTASQENPDSGQDGSTNWGGPALPTFGNPARSPAVYVRVGGGVAFRLKWTGSPHDMPMSAEVTFRLSNPDGEANLWTQTFGLLPSTVDNHGDVPVWDPTGNGYPPPATEFGYAYTSIPKYAVTGTPTSFTQLTAWNLNGDSASAAHLSTSVSFTTTSGSTVTWTNPDLAQTLGYPTWYFLHQIPDAVASYEQPQPTGKRSYTTSSLPQIGPNGRLVPTMMAPGP
ncbi:hypothetical protein, partial [Alicyclobacillus hesperidum]|uniref:hypothetical protein n=1 Tax=Alicyclobacillus hesperidum TaxID=89784 RepID=UPI00059149A1